MTIVKKSGDRRYGVTESMFHTAVRWGQKWLATYIAGGDKVLTADELIAAKRDFQGEVARVLNCLITDVTVEATPHDEADRVDYVVKYNGWEKAFNFAYGESGVDVDAEE